ncbi:rhomboid family intramembrane serine protease [Hydrogenothermus marinus]|uniref:Membrane associated rhomboid family serine protease n=1 Tax=Hydrogenothermus marinus TaxID=133270 RepID=A0A3M0BQU3_9AQUI|nr:rhomboid family intramembrane serine protease [Hydrogenothermus marinus]RMA97198.1 membrane associated rhomboid family serine protease [Hydrogenothermus marinus]
MIPIKDNIPTRNIPIINYSLIILNIIVFIYEITLSKQELELFFHTWGLLPVDLMNLHWINFLTAMFIHGGFAHLFGNMLFLYVFGDNVEDALGKIRYILLYILSGLGAALLQSVISLMSGSLNIPMIGASGAISGVLAAYVKLYPEAKVLTIIPPFIFFAFILPAWFFIGYWFLIQVLFAVSVPPNIGGVAWYAHIGGFITGWFLTDVLYPKKNPKLVHYSILR